MQQSNVALQLRRAKEFMLSGKRPLDKSAVAPSAASACYAAGGETAEPAETLRLKNAFTAFENIRLKIKVKNKPLITKTEIAAPANSPEELNS